MLVIVGMHGGSFPYGDHQGRRDIGYASLRRDSATGAIHSGLEDSMNLHQALSSAVDDSQILFLAIPAERQTLLVRKIDAIFVHSIRAFGVYCGKPRAIQNHTNFDTLTITFVQPSICFQGVEEKSNRKVIMEDPFHQRLRTNKTNMAAHHRIIWVGCHLLNISIMVGVLQALHRSITPNLLLIWRQNSRTWGLSTIKCLLPIFSLIKPLLSSLNSRSPIKLHQISNKPSRITRTHRRSSSPISLRLGSTSILISRTT
ncbi:unnamed protein product [Nesidiocoris tenuis]|uniref:Uncharacterized protein n=1 Tax=Nesidiocoris tenuis TaxID=355587 RepID=A0A6H5HR00_9HEMI|nr:unnamed protein product [Nesidiocoris tenuis]